MRLENSFEVPAAPEAAWELLIDVPRVIPCMPGATLDETVDDATWKATMEVKLGPISLTFATDVKQEALDEAARRAKLSARAREARGRGAAQAQYGRGIVEDVSSQLVTRFAECLKAQLAAAPEEAQAAREAQAKPVSGLSLAFGALGRGISRFFRRLLRRG